MRSGSWSSPNSLPRTCRGRAFTIVAPAFFACAINRIDSCFEDTLCPMVNSVAEEGE